MNKNIHKKLKEIIKKFIRSWGVHVMSYCTRPCYKFTLEKMDINR